MTITSRCRQATYRWRRRYDRQHLKPSLARGELQTIGATTLDDYRKYIERDPALERRFQPVNVDEPTVEETIDILNGVKVRYEEHHELLISEDAIKAAIADYKSKSNNNEKNKKIIK